MTRVSHEAFALQQLREVADSYRLPVHSGQNAANRIPISGGVYYQFGDLRVELPRVTLVVEVESSGGTTNLAKYWECYATGRMTKPMKLLHIFRQKSANDYESHMRVWRFLCDRMHPELGDKFEGRWLTYQDGVEASLHPACSLFNTWISDASE